jgi:subtilisin family serine protease
MLKIGVIDTGSDYFADGIAIDMLNARFSCDFIDHHGHGTAVASMLVALCPDACVVPVRIAQVIDGQSIARVPESVLSQGIEWCINNHIRLVNISYSIEDVHYDGPLATVCRKAVKHNLILVAAYRNNFTKPVYPAAFASVIGVSIRKDIDHAQISVVSAPNHDVAAFGGPYQIIAHGKESLWGGTSFATAQVTGMVGRMLAIRPTLSFQQVFRYLKKYSI